MRSRLLVGATALLLFLVVPVALGASTGDSGAPLASASAGVKKKVKKLTKRVKALEQRLDEQGGDGGGGGGGGGAGGAPSGPAGGDLSGNYPNPLIAANAVGTNEVAAEALIGDDIDESSLGQVPTAASAGFASSIANGSASAAKLGTLTRRTNTISVPGGTAGNGDYDTEQVEAACNPGELAISGGAEWVNWSPDDELPIVQSFLFTSTNPSRPDRWVVAGGNDTGSDETLRAAVWCLAP